MTGEQYTTDAESQRQRILAWLMRWPLTTEDARTKLDIMHPGGRIMELRRRGHNILTQWVVINTCKAKHRMASYVLLIDKTAKSTQSAV